MKLERSSYLGLIAATTILSASPLSSLADNRPQRGRTAEGRAYRIENGMRMSDYIADLEVENDDLKRQVIVLEDELDKLEATKPGAASRVPLRESNLINSTRNKPGLPAAAGAPAAATVACDTQVSSLQAKVRDLSFQLQDRIAAAASPASKVTSKSEPGHGTRCDYSSNENPWKQEAQKLQATLLSNVGAEGGAKGEWNGEQDRRVRAEASLEKLQLELRAQQEELSALKSELEQAKGEIATARGEEQAPRATLTAAKGDAPVLEAQAIPELKAEQPAELKTEALDADAVRLAKADFAKDLDGIQKLVIERKNLLDAVKAHGKGVSIQIRPLTTADGRSLDVLRVEVARLDTGTNVASIKNGLGEISEILSDDVSVLRRLSK